MRMPSSASAGRTESMNTCACRLAICCVRSPIRRSCSRGERPSAERTDRPISSRRFRPGDPHHVELVEVRREDRQELGPLQQRQRRVGGQRQHAGVEVEPAQFAVEIAVFGQRVADWPGAVAAGGASGAGPVACGRRMPRPNRCRPVELVSRLQSSVRSSPIAERERLPTADSLNGCSPWPADGPRRRRTHAESARHDRSSGVSMSQRSPGQRAGQLDGTRI